MPERLQGAGSRERPERPRGEGDPRRVLSLFYAVQFAHMGIVLPFLAPWLRDRGFGPVGIGLLMALPPLFKILAPWTWGPWADRLGRRKELLIAASAVAALALAAMTRVAGAPVLAVLVAVYGFTRAPILPYVEATSLEHAAHGKFSYGSVRLWGSLAFIAASSGYGFLHGRVGEDTGILVAAGALGLGALVALVAFPSDAVAHRDDGEAGAVRRRGLFRFFGACALMQASHGAYYTFYSIHLQDLGYGGAFIGSLWALAVLCEVLMFTRLDRIVDRYGSTAVLRVCLGVAAARWVLIGTVSAPYWLAAGQVLHAATYAGFHLAAIRVVHARFAAVAPARGQALYSGMTYGAGMFAGSLLAGCLADLIGLRVLFVASAAVAAAGAALLGRSALR